MVDVIRSLRVLPKLQKGDLVMYQYQPAISLNGNIEKELPFLLLDDIDPGFTGPTSRSGEPTVCFKCLFREDIEDRQVETLHFYRTCSVYRDGSLVWERSPDLLVWEGDDEA